MGFLCLTRNAAESVIIGERDYVLTVDYVNDDSVDYTVTGPDGTHKFNETHEPVYLNGLIKIKVLKVKGSQVRFGFDCDRGISVNRCEIYDRILKERAEGMREVAGG